MSVLLDQEEEIKGLDSLPPDALYEVIDGEVKEVSPLGFAANQIAFRLAAKMNEATKNPRDIVVMESLFSLPLQQRRRRRPDVAYVPAERVPDSWPPPFGEDPPALEAVPAVVVEVVSPTDVMNELEEKRQDYFNAGVSVLVLIYPKTRTTHVFESVAGARILTEADTLEIPQVLPGFSVRLADLFAPLNRPT